MPAEPDDRSDRAAAPRRLPDRLLKQPAQLARDLCAGDPRLAAGLLALAALAFAAYGLLMGAFTGGPLLWQTPLKVAGGVTASALLCLPSLYIFACYGGSRLSLSAVASLLLLGLALAATLLCGLLPVLWIFSTSTRSVAFMGFLHLLAWLVGTGFGLGFLRQALREHQEQGRGWLLAWSVIFLLVSLQMAATLRPLIGKPRSEPNPPAKVFFLKHWLDCLSRG